MSGTSIIIPTYENWPLLIRTLSCVVADCKELKTPWEVLLVDNESRLPWPDAVHSLLQGEPCVRLLKRTGLAGRNFQPGAARNLGIQQAHFDSLIFLDADSIPSAGLISTYTKLTDALRDVVFLGHRVFVNGHEMDPETIIYNRNVLDQLPPILSVSNYGSALDRRLPELKSLSGHSRPYDCLFGCNFSLHRECLGAERFDRVFDGHWGYEDIELGYRLYLAGRTFSYVPDAFVYHQEAGSLNMHQRQLDRARNFRIADRLISGFANYRRNCSRLEAVPQQLEDHCASA